MTAKLTLEQVHEIKDRAIELLIECNLHSMFALSKEYAKRYDRHHSYLINLMRKYNLTEKVMSHKNHDCISSFHVGPIKLNLHAKGFSQNIAHTRAYLG